MFIIAIMFVAIIMFVVTIMSLTMFGSRYPRCRSVIVAPISFSTCGGRKRFHNVAARPYQNWNTPSSRIPRILGFTNKSICSFNTDNINSFSFMAGLCRFFKYDDNVQLTTMFDDSTPRRRLTIRYLDWRLTMFDDVQRTMVIIRTGLITFSENE